MIVFNNNNTRSNTVVMMMMLLLVHPEGCPAAALHLFGSAVELRGGSFQSRGTVDFKFKGPNAGKSGCK